MKSETLTKFLFINFEEAYMPNWARGPLNLKETKKKIKRDKAKDKQPSKSKCRSSKHHDFVIRH